MSYLSPGWWYVPCAGVQPDIALQWGVRNWTTVRAVSGATWIWLQQTICWRCPLSQGQWQGEIKMLLIAQIHRDKCTRLNDTRPQHLFCGLFLIVTFKWWSDPVFYSFLVSREWMPMEWTWGCCLWNSYGLASLWCCTMAWLTWCSFISASMPNCQIN